MDIKLNYIEKGEGEPIVLLHGNGEDSSYFEHQIDVLAEKYHVFALDSRAHGKSPSGEKSLTIKQLVLDLYDFINEKELDRIHILGFSDGANIAMIFARDYPDRVGKLILNGGNLTPDGMIDKVRQAIERKYKEYLEKAEEDEEMRAKAEMFSLMVNDPNIPIDELHDIDTESLVIAGDKDMIKDEHTRLIADNIKGSKLVIMEGDHFIAKKKPEEFNKYMMEFLQG